MVLFCAKKSHFSDLVARSSVVEDVMMISPAILCKSVSLQQVLGVQVRWGGGSHRVANICTAMP